MIDSFRHYTGWNGVANRRNYVAPADPWGLVRVDPTAVVFYALVPMKWGLGRVEGGNWDRPEERRRVDDLRIHDGLVQRFEEDRDWEETVYYEWITERLNETGRFRGHSTVEAVLDQRCTALDNIYEEMRTEGYRPNLGTVYDDPEDAEFVHDLEPMILIGREGEVLWTEGFHRLVLADLVGVDRIPVFVLVRHEEWQAVRDELATTSPEERTRGLSRFEEHPDVRDLGV
jgi:hypothetical protein